MKNKTGNINVWKSSLQHLDANHWFSMMQICILANGDNGFVSSEHQTENNNKEERLA